MAGSLSTILFIEDNPVGYAVSRRGEAILFTPNRFAEKTCYPPQFSAIRQAEGYVFAEAITEDMKAQALQALNQLEAGKLLG